MSYTAENIPVASNSAAFAGKDWLMYLNYGASATIAAPVWKLVGSCRTNSLEITSNTIDATVKGSGSFAESIPGQKSWTMSAEIVAAPDNECLEVIEAFAMDPELSGTKKALNVALVNEETKEYYTGNVTVDSVSYSASYDDVVTASTSFTGSGKLEKKTNFTAA